MNISFTGIERCYSTKAKEGYFSHSIDMTKALFKDGAVGKSDVHVFNEHRETSEGSFIDFYRADAEEGRLLNAMSDLKDIQTKTPNDLGKVIESKINFSELYDLAKRIILKTLAK